MRQQPTKRLISDRKWDKMTNQQKRLAVVVDALAQFNTKIIKPATARYVHIENGTITGPIRGNRQVHKVVQTLTKPCQVCITGGLFMAFLGLRNGFTLDEFAGFESYVGGSRCSLAAINIEDRLSGIFGIFQLGIIELAWEGNLSGRFAKKVPSLSWSSGRAMAFHKDHPSERRRYRAILNNMIEHEGEFKP